MVREVEIKFRAKRADNGKWIRGYYAHNSDSIPCIISISDGDGGWLEEIDPATVGQFIGLLDKNGNEVFEGDIVAWGNEVAVVQWNNYAAGFEPYARWGSEDEPQPEKTVVVGNVYDNPELCFDVIISNPDFGAKTVYHVDKAIAEWAVGHELHDSDYHPTFGGYPVAGFESRAEAEAYCRQKGWRVR
jgi:hypothetical protein